MLYVKLYKGKSYTIDMYIRKVVTKEERITQHIEHVAARGGCFRLRTQIKCVNQFVDHSLNY